MRQSRAARFMAARRWRQEQTGRSRKQGPFKGSDLLPPTKLCLLPLSYGTVGKPHLHGSGFVHKKPYNVSLGATHLGIPGSGPDKVHLGQYLIKACIKFGSKWWNWFLSGGPQN